MQRLYSTACAALLLCSSSAGAQKLRDRLGQLVTFGDWTSPLQVGTISADGRTIVPSNTFVIAPNGMLVSFLVSWMSASAASAPIASTGGGTAFSFAGGVPESTQPSPGPVFGEPATTLGRGAVVAGANYTGVQFSRVRGVPLDNVRLTFTQGATPGTAADALDVHLNVDYDLAVASVFATAGLMDRIDVGVVLPLVRADLRGESTVRVIPGVAGAAPRTVIGGTPDAPRLESSQRISGSATGLGDVALRVKANVVDRPRSAFGVLSDVRFPTGDDANLLGSGSLSVRALGLYSGRFGSFSPHVSAGYLYYADASINNAVLANAGFDQDVAPWATLAASVITELQAGKSAYQLPPAASRPLANIPVVRDDAVSASLGFKFTASGMRAIVNALVPVTRGGPRPDFAYTFGVERDF